MSTGRCSDRAVLSALPAITSTTFINRFNLTLCRRELATYQRITGAFQIDRYSVSFAKADLLLSNDDRVREI